MVSRDIGFGNKEDVILGWKYAALFLQQLCLFIANTDPMVLTIYV
jgi:hypothetical protein